MIIKINNKSRSYRVLKTLAILLTLEFLITIPLKMVRFYQLSTGNMWQFCNVFSYQFEDFLLRSGNQKKQKNLENSWQHWKIITGRKKNEIKKAEESQVNLVPRTLWDDVTGAEGAEHTTTCVISSVHSSVCSNLCVRVILSNFNFFSQCFGSGSWAGSVCFWASWIRIQ